MRTTLFRALERAGALVRDHSNKRLRVEFKNNSRINLVTWVDKAADRLIRGILRQRHPDHDILTEEAPPVQRGSSYRWIVDPLDGTTNYAHGFPQVGVSIGLEYAGRAVLGGVYDPFRDELFWAEKGHGAFLSRQGGPHRPISVSRTQRLEEALLITGFPYDRRERADFYLGFVKAFLARVQGIRRVGAAALDLCWIACGRADGYWEWRLKPWDTAAGALIVEEAGGRVSGFHGQPHHIDGEQTLASNGRVHQEMLKVFRRLLKE